MNCWFSFQLYYLLCMNYKLYDVYYNLLLLFLFYSHYFLLLLFKFNGQIVNRFCLEVTSKRHKYFRNIIPQNLVPTVSTVNTDIFPRICSFLLTRIMFSYLSLKCSRFQIHKSERCNKESPAQVFFCKFCEISESTFFTEHLRRTASRYTYYIFLQTGQTILMESLIIKNLFPDFVQFKKERIIKNFVKLIHEYYDATHPLTRTKFM